jgi:glycosyltransferase involved in cell wall biosynthesis
VALYEPSGLGGVCHYTYQLAQALTQQGCDVTLITTEAYELAHLPRRFRVRHLFKRSRLKRLLLWIPRQGWWPRRRAGDWESATPPHDPSAWMRALRLRLLQVRMALELAARHTDIVHLQSVRDGRDLFFVRLLGWLRLPVLYTAHEAQPHEGEAPPDPADLRAVYETVTRIIVHAERTREELLGRFGVRRHKVEVVPHGSYDFFFPEGRISRDAARARLGFPVNRRTILFFGLIKRYKGLEYLVEAFGRIEESMPDAVLAIVGNVFRGDPIGYARYSRLLEEVSRQPNVLRVEGYVPVGKVGLYLSAADVVVLPHTETSQSGVLLGAFAAGRPVVVTDTGGFPETVEDGRTGYVVPPRDPKALADAILRVLEKPEAAEAMGQNAARQADTIYSWNRIAARTVEVYNSAISDGRRAFQ